MQPWPRDAQHDLLVRICKEAELSSQQMSCLFSVVEIIDPVPSSSQTVLRYGTFVEFLQVTGSLIQKYRKQLQGKQEIITQAVYKLEQAAKRVGEMEQLLQKSKADLAHHKGAPASFIN